MANQQSLKQKQGGYGHVCSLYPNILSSITLICSYVQTTSAVCQCALLVTRSCDVGHICLSAICSSAPPTSGVRFEKKKFSQQKCASQKAEKQKLTQGFCLLMYVAGHVSSFFPLCFLHDSAISLPQVGRQFALVAKRARISCRCLFACELYSA